MPLRVIAGKAKGRKLKAVTGDTTRPVTDRVKEALFNILAGAVIDSNWWDVFAGTGAIGIEALSRGASSVRFTDFNRGPIATIRYNVQQCGFESQSEIRRGDAFRLLASTPDQAFEYIYIAPPQYRDMWSKAVELVDENIGWLQDDGWMIAQIDPKEEKALDLEHLKVIEQRKYGNTLLIFFEKKVV